METIAAIMSDRDYVDSFHLKEADQSATNVTQSPAALKGCPTHLPSPREAEKCPLTEGQLQGIFLEND